MGWPPKKRTKTYMGGGVKCQLPIYLADFKKGMCIKLKSNDFWTFTPQFLTLIYQTYYLSLFYSYISEGVYWDLGVQKLLL